MSYSFWTNPELGAAIEALNYEKMDSLLALGASFNSCIRKYGLGGFEGNFKSALDYALSEKDVKLVKYIVNNGGNIVAIPMPELFTVNIASPDKADCYPFADERDREIFEFLSKTAYESILKNTMPVFANVVRGIILYRGLIPDENVKIKLFAATEANDTNKVGRILEELVRKKDLK